MLGDILNDDANYTGDTGDSALTMQFYRNKASEYQAVMQALDQGAMSAYATAALFPDDEDLQNLISELEGKRGAIVGAANAINLASQSLNAMGIRFPVVSVSGLAGMGAIPIAAVAIVAGAVGTAAVLISWGVAWLNNLYAKLMQLEMHARISDPALADQVAAQAVNTAAASAAATNPLSQVAGIVKFIAFGAAGFLAYRLYLEMTKKGD